MTAGLPGNIFNTRFPRTGVKNARLPSFAGKVYRMQTYRTRLWIMKIWKAG